MVFNTTSDELGDQTHITMAFIALLLTLITAKGNCLYNLIDICHTSPRSKLIATFSIDPLSEIAPEFWLSKQANKAKFGPVRGFYAPILSLYGGPNPNTF